MKNHKDVTMTTGQKTKNYRLQYIDTNNSDVKINSAHHVTRRPNKIDGFGMTILAFGVAVAVPFVFGFWWLSLVILVLAIAGIWAYSVWQVKP